jgi:hypothetical protein
MKQYGDIELQNSQILNLRVDRKDALPSFTANDESRLVYNNIDNTLYFNNGIAYVALQIASENANPVLVSLGGDPTDSDTYWFNPDNSFNAAPFTSLAGGFFSNTTASLFDVISQINDVLNNLSNLSINEISGFAVESPNAGDILYFDGDNFVSKALTDIPSLGINIALPDLTDVTIGTTNDNDGIFFNSQFNGGKFINQKFMFKGVDGGQHTSYTVTHSLGHKFCTLTVFDTGTSAQLFPSTVSFTNTESLTFSLGTNPSASGVTYYVTTIPVQN